MGVLNVTPDSFSDGGRYTDLSDAVAHGQMLRADGAHLVDVGGESTRPGAERVDAATETERVVPVVRELSAEGVPVSIDTTRAAVAEAALAAGAVMVNDVSGGLADPDMAGVVAAAGCPWVLMHWRGHSKDMRMLATYTDVVAEVRDELSARIDAALAAGVSADALVVDPGLGFAKTPAHNWALLAGLDALIALGPPVLLGTSRKSFLGSLLAGDDGSPRPVDEREYATVATTVLAAQAGVWGLRVHDVRANVDALRVWSSTPRRRPAAEPARADRIALTGLRVRGRHGVFDFERADGQEFLVDAVLETDVRPAARSDALADTVDYGALADQLAAVVAGDPVNLLETLAERLAEVCLAQPGVCAADVTVHKPQAPIGPPFGDVSVSVHRKR